MGIVARSPFSHSQNLHWPADNILQLCISTQITVKVHGWRVYHHFPAKLWTSRNCLLQSWYLLKIVLIEKLAPKLLYCHAERTRKMATWQTLDRSMPSNIFRDNCETRMGIDSNENIANSDQECVFLATLNNRLIEKIFVGGAGGG